MKKKTKIMDKIRPYLFIAPAVIMVILFMWLSVGLAFVYSLTDKLAASGTNFHFIGLENFTRLMGDKIFWQSFRNQVFITIFAVFNSVFWPLLAALLIYDVRKYKGAKAARIAFVLPMMVPGIVTILIWKFLYNPNYGFNSFLKLFHLDFLIHNWLNDRSTALACVILVGFPFVSGMYFLLFHSGLNEIDESLYDAALVDGAGKGTILRYIQLPGVWPYVKLVMTLSLISSLASYGLVSAMTGGGPGSDTMIPALYMYNVAFGDGRQGYGSAVGVVLFIIIIVLTIVLNRLMAIGEDKDAA